jgi:hypothetical protein
MFSIIENRKYHFIISAIVLAFFVFTFPLFLQASGIDSAVKGLNTSANQGFLGQSGDGELKDGEGVMVSLPSAIGKIVGAALSFIGVIFFILMIYGGLLWMTAAGNDQQVEKAKDLIVAAIIGLVIVFAAYAITSFIGTSLTK